MINTALTIMFGIIGGCYLLIWCNWYCCQSNNNDDDSDSDYDSDDG